METILKQMQAVSEPTVIFSDIDDVVKVLSNDGIPDGTYAVGTHCIKIKLFFLESESDNLQIAIRHKEYVIKLPLIKTGFKGCYSLCVCMPGCGPTDLKAFKVLWNKIHGYQLQQFEDEAGNRVKLVQTGAIAPRNNLRVTGTSRPKMSSPSEESDSDTPTEQSTDVPDTKEVLRSSQKEDEADKEDPRSFGTSEGIVEKDGSADKPVRRGDTSEESSAEDAAQVEAIDDRVDDTNAGGSGPPPLPECSESKATGTARPEISKSKLNAIISSLLPQGVPVTAESSLTLEVKMGKGRFSVIDEASKLNAILSSLLPKGVPVTAESSFTLEAKMGKGRFSVIDEASFQIGENVDDMRIKTKIASFGRQIMALAALQHQNVVSLMTVCVDGRRLELLTEYIDGGTLQNYLKGPNVGSLTPPELVGMSRQVATGMEYIAGRGWLHGELTSRNVLLTSALECKITGFGSATLATDTQHTVNYPHSYAAAIEVHQNKDFTSKSDVWSFGILFMEIMSRGQTPYRGRVDPTQLKVYLEIGNRWKRPDCVSQEHYALMQRCWKLKQRARPSFQQIVTALT